MNDPEAGKDYEVPAPFVRDVYSELGEDGYSYGLTWRPGVVWDAVGPEDTEAVAHGIGAVTYSVIELHKLPSPFPARVFFTRKWTDPDGRKFGRGKLHIMTLQAFKRRMSGYKAVGAYDGFVVRDLDDDGRNALLAKS